MSSATSGVVAGFGSTDRPSDTVLEDSRGNLWLGTAGQGLWFARGYNDKPRRIEQVAAVTGLSSDFVNCVYEDRAANVWVGTRAGLHQFSLRSITSVTDLGVVRAVAAEPDDSIWVATADGVIRLRGANREKYTKMRGVPSSDVNGLFSDPRGVIWAATAGGVVQFANGRFSPLRLPADSPLTGISAMTVDPNGDIWLGDRSSGLFRWRDGQLTRIEAVPDVTSIFSLSTDSDGRVWVGFAGGRAGFLGQDGHFVVHDQIDGITGTVYFIFEDRRKTIWIGASDGLARLQDGKFVAVNSSRNGFPRVVTSLLEDEKGSLWVGTSNGILVVERSEFDKVAVSASHRVDYRLYDEGDGLPAMPYVGRPGGVRTADGRLWFVTGNGLAVVDPPALQKMRVTPRVHIESVMAGTRHFDPVPGLVLPPKNSSLQIEYTAVTFSSPTKVRFRYRLDGFDEEWQDAGSRRQAIYTNLPRRSYRFQVMASGKDGWSHASGAALEFLIRPMFYETWWFYASCALGTIIVIWSAWRLRLEQYQRQFRLVLAERTRISRDIHDTLLQSLVGAVLEFDSLAEAATGPVRAHLISMRRELQEHVREARDTIWNLRSPALEERDLTASLREIGERLAQRRSIRFQLRVFGKPRPLPRFAQEQLLRIGQEAIANAFRHAQAKEVTVELQYDDSSIALRVADNGCGFDQTLLAKDSHQNFGIISMRERAENVGGEFSLRSTPGRGTEVAVVVPAGSLQEAHA